MIFQKKKPEKLEIFFPGLKCAYMTLYCLLVVALTLHPLMCKVRLKHGLMYVSRMGGAHALMSENHTEGHALTYLKYVTIASFDPRQLWWRN